MYFHLGGCPKTWQHFPAPCQFIWARVNTGITVCRGTQLKQVREGGLSQLAIAPWNDSLAV